MAYLVGAPLAGVVVDRLGARRGFAAAVVVWSVVAGAHALATSFASLFALRVLLGAAESPSFPAAAQAIRRALARSAPSRRLRTPLHRQLARRHRRRAARGRARGALRLSRRLPRDGDRRGRVDPVLALRDAGGGRLATRPETLGGRSRRRARPPPRWFDVVKSPPVLRASSRSSARRRCSCSSSTGRRSTSSSAGASRRAGVGSFLMAAPLIFDVGAVGLRLPREHARESRARSAGTHARAHVASFAAVLASCARVRAARAVSPACDRDLRGRGLRGRRYLRARHGRHARARAGRTHVERRRHDRRRAVARARHREPARRAGRSIARTATASRSWASGSPSSRRRSRSSLWPGMRRTREAER